MTTKLNPVLSRDKLKITYEKHLKTKGILCKLPIIDMSQNTFSKKKNNELMKRNMGARNRMPMFLNS
jgi:hypothetical protein